MAWKPCLFPWKLVQGHSLSGLFNRQLPHSVKLVRCCSWERISQSRAPLFSQWRQRGTVLCPWLHSMKIYREVEVKLQRGHLALRFFHHRSSNVVEVVLLMPVIPDSLIDMILIHTYVSQDSSAYLWGVPGIRKPAVHKSGELVRSGDYIL
jgi:hypothetical protein